MLETCRDNSILRRITVQEVREAVADGQIVWVCSKSLDTGEQLFSPETVARLQELIGDTRTPFV